ncbi:peptidyl-prolyl cis-trans isomerase-like 1 [Acrodontium crateriforme]|uniref:Peptidyl-prolyl cis-trans isomerase n=1 Tax=Acrodontium crateriforme TaxID=150365 RepID=A0AAQ3M7K5_9PEZI|nr:peptidyl-prolyl cis-trans isomerase-like 1 [Acrodontium crateriforme]
MNKLKSLFGKKDHDSSASSTPTSSSNQNPTPTSSSVPATTGAGAGDDNIPDGVILHTTLGDMTIALFKTETPKTARNFATLASTGKYNNVIFHRIIPGFMIQGGDPTGTGRGGTSIYGAKFDDEFHPSLRHTGKGILSMANSGPGTNGSQFFVTLAPTPHLDGKHTVFGRVVQGMDVVDRLGAVGTDSGDRPLQEVKILTCEVFHA